MTDAAVPRAPTSIRTARLDLLAPEPAFVQAVHEAVEESRETLAEWMPWALEPDSLDDLRDRLVKARARFDAGEDFSYRVFERESGELVGAVGLHRMDWAVPRFEIGYWVRDSAVGQGFAGEATEAVTDVAFSTLGALRVEIRMSDANVKSVRIAERLGFELEGTLRSYRRGTRGQIEHVRIYAKVR